MSYWSSYDDDKLVCGFVNPKFAIGGSFEASDQQRLLFTDKAATMVTTIIIIITTATATGIKVTIIVVEIVKWPNAVVSATRLMTLFVIVAELFGYLDRLT